MAPQERGETRSIWERFPRLGEIPRGGFPRHLLIIPDGNRRWAMDHKVQAVLGHKSGMAKTLELMRDLDELPIEFVTFWVFSSSNWKRPKEETSALFAMLEQGLRDTTDELMERNIRLKRIGRVDRTPDSLVTALVETISKTSKNTGTTVVLAIDFGGEDQRLRMFEDFRTRVLANPAVKVTNELVQSLQDEHGLLPPADLIFRTSEKRTSGIGWLEGEETDLYFLEGKLFPDVQSQDIVDAIVDFSKRRRPMGA